MENKYLVKPHQNFEAEVDIPGSKSVANRALILAAFAEGIVGFHAPDTEHTPAYRSPHNQGRGTEKGTLLSTQRTTLDEEDFWDH